MKKAAIPKKTLVIGSRSYVGKACLQALRIHYPNVIGTDNRFGSKHYLDLRNLEISSFPTREVEYAIIAAGIPSVSHCERFPNETNLINVEKTLELSKKLIDKGVTPILFSSDYIFDGRNSVYYEDTTPSPLNIYGEQKAELEARVSKECGENYLLFRTSKIYDLNFNGKGFLFEIYQNYLRNKSLSVVDNQFIWPIHLENLIEIIFEAQSRNLRGVFQVSGTELWNRHELTIQLLKKMTGGSFGVKKISLEDLSEYIRLPKQVNMSMSKLSKELTLSFMKLSSWLNFSKN